MNPITKTPHDATRVNWIYGENGRYYAYVPSEDVDSISAKLKSEGYGVEVERTNVNVWSKESGGFVRAKDVIIVTTRD